MISNTDKKNILYLEDDEALSFITSRALQKRGFTVLHYSSIEEIDSALETTTYSYALLDLKIGQETSLHLIKKIKQHNDIPIVILTGYGTIRTAVQAMQLGAINFLTKPCGMDEVIAAFKEGESTHESHNSHTMELQKPSLRSVEWETIQRALDENEGNISAAARQLKMHRRTLQRKLNKRHLEQDCQE